VSARLGHLNRQRDPVAPLVSGAVLVLYERLGAGGIDSMTSADEKPSSVHPISIDMLCKVCVLVLLGIEVTTGDLVHRL